MLKRIAILLMLLFCFQAVDAQWVKQRSGTFAWLRDILFVDQNRGWIVGTDGTMLVTQDGGTTWTQLPKLSNDAILQIKFTDQNNGWMLCERDVYSRGQKATSYMRRTTDGGKKWERVEFVDGGRERVTKFLISKNGHGAAVGEKGVFFTLQPDGETWKKTPSPNQYLLLGGAFSEGLSGSISGTGGTILFTQDEGSSWERATVLVKETPRLNSVFFTSPRNGWAVGSGGSILTTASGGRLWRQQDSNSTADLLDVCFTSPREGWAVGDRGTILRTSDGGVTWASVESHVPHRIERVVFNGRRGWAVGFGGTILAFGIAPGVNDAKPRLRPKDQ